MGKCCAMLSLVEGSKWQEKRKACQERVMCDTHVESAVNLSHGVYVSAWRQNKQRKQEQEWQSNPPVKAALEDLSRQVCCDAAFFTRTQVRCLGQGDGAHDLTEPSEVY
eukprot:265589-Pelagomonas_calceolata.AAC.3